MWLGKMQFSLAWYLGWYRFQNFGKSRGYVAYNASRLGTGNRVTLKVDTSRILKKYRQYFFKKKVDETRN